MRSLERSKDLKDVETTYLLADRYMALQAYYSEFDVNLLDV